MIVLYLMFQAPDLFRIVELPSHRLPTLFVREKGVGAGEEGFRLPLAFDLEELAGN